ncbi:GTP-binding protein TrmE N-terminus-domain-containing protein [Suillus cothurnatus]|nr:GTP-binding protein TrmE N-terminus-domain-containing protein [Suillus cothurnatus]
MAACGDSNTDDIYPIRSPYTTQSSGAGWSSSQFDATGCASRTHTTLFVKSEPTLSDAQRRTIYALSTPPGKEARRPGRLVVNDTQKKSEDTPTPWMVQRRHVVDPETEERLDDILTVFFKGPKSFTTEDTLELHIHSGHAVLSAVLRALAKLPYCRPAI